MSQIKRQCYEISVLIKSRHSLGFWT